MVRANRGDRNPSVESQRRNPSVDTVRSPARPPRPPTTDRSPKNVGRRRVREYGPPMARKQAPTFNRSRSFKTVAYEYEMAFVLCNQIMQPPREEHLRYAALESFLAHIRNLDEFFSPRTSGDLAARTNPKNHNHGAVWACDFVPGFGQRTLTPAQRQNINRLLQHMTTWRQRPVNLRWRYIELFAQPAKVMDDFLPHLHANYRRRLGPTHEAARALVELFGLLD